MCELWKSRIIKTFCPDLSKLIVSEKTGDESHPHIFDSKSLQLPETYSVPVPKNWIALMDVID